MTHPANTPRRPDGAAPKPGAGPGAYGIAVLLLVLGQLMIREAGTIPETGGYSGVGPAEIPRMIGYALLGLGIWTIVARLRGDVVETPKQDFLPVLWIVGGLLAQLLLMPVAGFAIGTGLLFAFTARGFGKRELWLTVPIGIVFSLAVYGIFDRLLKLNLPTGPVETLIFGG